MLDKDLLMGKAGKIYPYDELEIYLYRFENRYGYLLRRAQGGPANGNTKDALKDYKDRYDPVQEKYESITKEETDIFWRCNNITYMRITRICCRRTKRRKWVWV